MMYEQGGGQQNMQQQMPPQPPQSVRGQSNWYNAAAGAAGAAGVPDLYANVAATAAQQAMGQHGQKYVGLLQRWLNIEKLRFYFEVNNQYVMDKLLLVLFAPLLHFGADTIRMPKFKFPEDYQVDSDAARQPPKYDLHAPDLYIPSMAFVTYVLVSAFALGTSGKFNPEVIFTTGWSCIGLLVLELMIIKGGCMFLNSKNGVPSLDVLGYCGYKFVGLTILVTVHLLLGSTIANYVIFLLFSATMAFFLIQSLGKSMGSDINAGESLKILRWVIGALQIPFFFFLMP